MNKTRAMYRTTVCSAILPLLAICYWPAPLGADVVKDEEAAIAAIEDLTLVEKDNWGEIYANPNVDWSVYTQIQLVDATIAFRRNWQRDQNSGDPFKVQNKDVENIKLKLSEQFRTVFTEELTQNGGYVMSDSPGANVLTISPAIVDLDIAAPDTMRPYNSRQFTDSAGQMTLKLGLYDSVTGDLLATASDRKISPYRGYYQWTTSVSNLADSRRMLQQWAQALRKRLDEARANSAPAAAAGAK